MSLLGLAGPMGSGKDHVQRYLSTLYRYVERRAFADALKVEVAELFDIDTTIKPYSEHVRWLLQGWGSKRRDEVLDYWIRLTNLHSTPGELVVITDVRYANEVEAIHHVGGTVAFVEAPFKLRAERIGVAPFELTKRSKHLSEQLSALECDHIIGNLTDYADPELGTSLKWWLRAERVVPLA